MRSVLLIGAGGLAKEVVALLEGSEIYKPVALLDDDSSRHGLDFAGLPVTGGVESVGEHDDSDILVCTGSGTSRRSIVNRLSSIGIGSARYATAVAPDLRVSSGVSVGAGSIVMSGTVLTASVSIGQHTVLMPNVVCTHDNRLADYVTLCAGVALGGSVEIGEEAYLGMNSSVRQNLRIGARAVLGMGAVLLTDLPSDDVWAGNPAVNINSEKSRQ